MQRIGLFSLLVFLPWSLLMADEQAILEIIINGHNTGQQFVHLNSQDEVLMSAEVLKALRLRETLWADQNLPVALNNLRPKVEFKLDRQASTLVLAVPPEWLEPQIIVREQATPPPPPPENLLRPHPLSGFLNYQVQANWQQQDSFNNFSLPWEVGFNVNQWFASSTFTSNYSSDSSKTHRGFSRLTWDDPQHFHTLVLGDFTAPHSLLGSGSSFGGISWRKNFHLDRQFKFSPNLDLHTVVESPSHAELYANGRQVKEWEVLPGEVTFADLGSYAGSDAELVLTDAFGRVTRLEVPTMVSQRLLKAGLREYSYNLGFPREHQGEKNAAYGSLTLLGFHRYGVTDKLTAGLNFSFDKHLFNLGPNVATLVGQRGQLESGIQLSKSEDQGTGWAVALRYSYRHKQFNTYLGLDNFSRHYRDLNTFNTMARQTTELETVQPTRYQGSLNLTYNHQQFGSLGVAYSEQRRWDDAAVQQITLNYRKQFSSGILLWLGTKRNFYDSEQNEIFLNLIYYPKVSGKEPFYDNVSYRLSEQEKGHSQQIGIQKTFPRGLGYGYVLDVEEEKGDITANARAQYRTRRGVYTADFGRGYEGDYNANLSVAGGLAWVDSGFYSGRPITDSFAVVQVTGLDNVGVRHQNTSMGNASENAPLLLPELSSYSRNTLTIDPQQLPLNYVLSQGERYIEIGQRSGSVVDFEFTRFTAVEGNLYWQTTDTSTTLSTSLKRIELEALPLEFEVGTEKRTAFLGRKGYFYLENLPIGELSLRVRRAGGDCSVNLTIPDTDKIVSNLGELACIPIH